MSLTAEAVSAASLMDALPAHAALLDSRTRIVAVNAAWRAFAAANDLRSSDAGLGQDYLAVCAAARPPHAEGAESVAEGIRSVLAGTLPEFTLDYPCHAPTEQRWFRVKVTPLPHGDQLCALVLHLNISDDITSQQRAREGEAHYRAMFERNASPMWVYDPADLRFLAVNDAAVLHYGYSHDEFLAMGLPDIRPPEDVPALLADLLETRRLQPVESHQTWRHRRKDGSVIVVEVHAHQIPWRGRPARLVLAQDITQRVAAEEGLRESEQRFRQLTDCIAEVFWLTEGDRLLYVSPAYETIWGRSRASLLGDAQQWLQSIHPDDRERVHQALHLQASGGYDVEYRIVRPDGSTRWVADRAFPVPGASGGMSSPPRLAGVAHDITERKQMQQQLQQAARLESLGQLTGGVAHDFNNLLTVMLGNAELLAEQLPQGGLPQRLAQMIGSAAQRGADLTQRLLAFARKQALAPRVVHLGRLVAEMDGLLRRTLGEQIEMKHHPEPELWSTLVDPVQFENVLLNLAINARDAMPHGGRLRMETRNASLDAAFVAPHAGLEAGDYAVLSVSDTGCGIAPQHLGRVFEPFFTTKERGKGTGLGLAMVYGFVRQSRGHITLSSVLGQGTTVSIYLPRDLGTPCYVRPPDEEGDSPCGTGQLVLLVEDDPMVRRFASSQLETLNYRVLEAADGRQALELLRQRSDVQLLFTDVVMPGGMTGAELAAAAVALHPQLPVLYTSGYSESALTHEGRLAPGVQLLGKPYRRAELALKLHEALRNSTPSVPPGSRR